MRSLVWVLTSSVVVAGVVEGDDEPTCEEFTVEAETRRVTALPLWPSVPVAGLSPLLDMRLLFLPRFLRKDGIVTTTALVCAEREA